MREVRMEKWCDLCWLDGEQRTAAVHSFAVGVVESTTRGPLVRLMEACDVHAKPLLELAEVTARLPTWVAEKSAPRSAPPAALAVSADHGPQYRGSPSSQPKECRICTATLIGTSALIGHIYGKHVAGPRPPVPTVCPECGTRIKVAVSMATHRRLEHGFDALEYAYSQVYNQPQLTA